MNTSKNRIHFLHVGKTGGTSIKEALSGSSGVRDQLIILHEHATRFYDVPVGDKVFFFLRNPVDRFVSGFYSRQRQGQPRYHSLWTPDEETAFKVFKTANQLAESLSKDAAGRKTAENAMRAIAHVNTFYSDWFHGEQYIKERLKDILFIGFQENLTRDFEKLKILLGVEENLELPQDEIKAHKNPQGIDKRLSDLARKNLDRWYEKDIEFYNWCKNGFSSPG